MLHLTYKVTYKLKHGCDFHLFVWLLICQNANPLSGLNDSSKICLNLKVNPDEKSSIQKHDRTIQ